MLRWQWHQLDNMQIICTSLQTDNHAIITPHHSFFMGWMLFLKPSQQCQSTEGIWQQSVFFSALTLLVGRKEEHPCIQPLKIK